eukprot:2851746-Pyramimonas_sp.AAC.1
MGTGRGQINNNSSLKIRAQQQQQHKQPQHRQQQTLNWQVTQPYACVNIAIVNVVFGGAHCGATNRMRGAPTFVA